MGTGVVQELGVGSVADDVIGDCSCCEAGEVVELVEDAGDELVVAMEMESNDAEHAEKRFAEIRAMVSRVKDKVLKLGIPGLVVCNVLYGAAYIGPSYAIAEGSAVERFETAVAVAAVSTVTSSVFFALMALVGVKVRDLVKRKREVEDFLLSDEGDEVKFGDVEN